jgi:hypothetical protein
MTGVAYQEDIINGYTLIRVGTEATNDSEGRPWHGTMALLGRFV